jgi:multiple sugar transport system substrate-binding protein
MKKTFLIAWIVMMIILAISVVSFAEEVTLRIAWWGSQDRTNRTLKVIELFEEKYPNVKIEPEFLGWDDYWQKIAVEAAGKNLPGVFQFQYAYLSQFVEKDLLLNLDPYVEDNRLNLTDVTETEIAGGRFNKKLYAVSLGTIDELVCIYDPELFKKAGVEEPTPDWTWEDYTEKATKIHTALGIYADDPYDGCILVYGLWFYLTQHGKDLYDKSLKKLGYEDDSLFVNYYTRFVDLIKEGVNTPPAVSIENYALENTLITRQKSAMIMKSSNQSIAVATAAGRPLSMTILPNAKDQVQYGTIISTGSAFSVAKNYKYPEWAVKFIDFFTNDLEANKILLGERGIPISSKVREGIKPYLTGIQKVMFDFSDVFRKHSSPSTYTFPPASAQIEDLLLTLAQKTLYGELTPEQAAKEFREKANKILAE